MVWKYPTQPVETKFKTQPSARKVMLNFAVGYASTNSGTMPRYIVNVFEMLRD
jgi:hypothetical protein